MSLYHELYTVIVAALPVVELRGALPLAIFVWEVAPFKAYVLSVIGNFLPVIPLLFFWRHCAQWLSHRSPLFQRLWEDKLAKTRVRHAHRFENLKSLALFTLVAVPLPFTGAWTGTVAAFVFGVSFPRAAFTIGVGIIVAGLLVLGGLGLFL